MVKLYRSPWPCCTPRPAKRRHREGYADNDTGLLAQPSMTASEFLRSKDPTQILAERSKIVFEDDAIGNHVLTDQEVRACGRLTCIVEGRLPVFIEMEG